MKIKRKKASVLESEYSKVRVNNEMDFCSVTEPEVKSALEKAFMKARVSYFLRWEKPGIFSRIFAGGKTRIVFCINSAQVDTADDVIRELGDIEGGIRMIRARSNNRVGF